MKITKLIILCSATFYCITGLFAQNWAIGGNPNADVSAGGGRLGTNGDRSVIFETNNTERARLLNGNGFWGFRTAAPNAQVHINSAAGTDALRVQVNGSSKLYVHNGGGVSVGSASAPPANGLFVSGSVGIGTTTPEVKLHVEGGTDASLAGSGYIVSGATNGVNIAIDNDEIMARNNGDPSTLWLNYNGGDVIINGTNVDETNVGIGTPSPESDLYIVHETGFITNGLTLNDNFASGLDWNIYSATSGELWLSKDGSHIGSFNGTSGVYTTLSDKKFKKDIASLENVLEKVMKLNPRLYHFNTQNQPNTRKYIGLIAQEVQPLFPEAVYEHMGKNDGSDDYLTLDYSAFGVIAVKAIQEQQQKITSLEDRIAKLESVLNTNSSGSANNIISHSKEINGASLEQNHPNPFSQTTTIHYAVPQSANAQIIICDASGKVSKTLQATQSGQAQINSYDLKPGVYTYTLVVNGKVATSKKMILMK